MLFDRLVTGQVVPMNPVAAVPRLNHVVNTGKAPGARGGQVNPGRDLARSATGPPRHANLFLRTDHSAEDESRRACEFADLRPRTLPPAARQVKAGFQTTFFAALRRGFYSEVNFFTPVLQISSESGRRSFHSAITPGCAAPSPSPNWRRASRRALRCGQPACSGQWRRRHGSGELPCMQRQFLAASCHLPKQALDR
jgi:hypothetical protein